MVLLNNISSFITNILSIEQSYIHARSLASIIDFSRSNGLQPNAKGPMVSSCIHMR